MQKKIITIIALILLGILIGYGIKNDIYTQTVIELEKNDQSYKEVSISMNDPPEVILSSECKQIKFNITTDQALSILYAMKKTELQRPLTQDTLLDITNYYNISILNMRIDRKDKEIYKGTIFLNQFGKILELDARPSDIISISLRSKNKLFVKESIMDRVC